MTSPSDLPAGDPFNAICPDAQYHGSPHRYCACGWMEEQPKKLHAYIQTKDLNDGVRYATRLALDRARRENYNPRQGTVTVYFDDDGVGAKWEPKP
jgi:hypothetical protein